MKKQILLTGERPTGRLHIGHYVGSLKKRVEMQNSGNYDCYVMIADTQALSDNANNPEKIRESLLHVALDNLSVGLDPKKSTIFVQSAVQELSEITLLLANLVTVARLERNPTIKTEIKQKGMEKSVPAGFLMYPISQAADILGFKTDVVPVGEDQVPVCEQAKEILRSFNAVYNCEVFHDFKIVMPENKHERRLMGIDGSSKMSKSLNNCIYLSDDSSTVNQKVMSMYTDPNHIKITDPGKVEGNVVFAYLDAFYENKKQVEEWKKQYRKGGLGDVFLKKELYNCLERLLTPIRARRKYYETRLDEVKKFLIDGNKKARKIVAQTLNEMRRAIGFDYKGILE